MLVDNINNEGMGIKQDVGILNIVNDYVKSVIELVENTNQNVPGEIKKETAINIFKALFSIPAKFMKLDKNIIDMIYLMLPSLIDLFVLIYNVYGIFTKKGDK